MCVSIDSIDVEQNAIEMLALRSIVSKTSLAGRASKDRQNESESVRRAFAAWQEKDPP